MEHVYSIYHSFQGKHCSWNSYVFTKTFFFSVKVRLKSHNKGPACLCEEHAVFQGCTQFQAFDVFLVLLTCFLWTQFLLLSIVKLSFDFYFQPFKNSETWRKIVDQFHLKVAFLLKNYRSWGINCYFIFHLSILFFL